MPRAKIATWEQIVDRVDRKEVDMVSLFKRQDHDYSLWINDEFDGAGVGYHSYTSNDPRTFGRKAVSILSGSALTAQTPQENDDGQERDKDNAAEQFALGNFKANDERLGLLEDPTPLQQAMAWHLCIRGRTIGRHALVKERKNGELKSWADATPFDPRNCTWEYGPNGLLWLCNKTYKTRLWVKETYNVEDDGQETDLVAHYDYYDTRFNDVVVPAMNDGKVRHRKHGLGRTICWNVPSTLQPLVLVPPEKSSSQENAALGAALKDFGESIYAENRKIWPAYMLMMSIMMELASRSRKPIFGIESESGVKVVEGDPFKEGAEIPLRVNEKLIVYDMLKSAPDLINFMTLVGGEMQRGGFPVIMFGETPATISGFAMNTLKSGVADKVLPMAQAMAMALKQITNAWRDHLETRAFGTLELSGRGNNRQWFSASISADDLQDLPELEIELTPQLPEDDIGKMNWAQLARTPDATGRPLLSDHTILERGLQVQDSDLERASVDNQMAAQNPLVRAARLSDSAARRGDSDAAQAWDIDFQMNLFQLQQTLAQAGTDLQEMMARFSPPPGPITGGGLDSNGINPEVLPNAAQGFTPPEPLVDTPGQAGAFVEPGTERPGAQGEQR